MKRSMRRLRHSHSQNEAADISAPQIQEEIIPKERSRSVTLPRTLRKNSLRLRSPRLSLRSPSRNFDSEHGEAEGDSEQIGGVIPRKSFFSTGSASKSFECSDRVRKNFSLPSLPTALQEEGGESGSTSVTSSDDSAESTARGKNVISSTVINVNQTEISDIKILSGDEEGGQSSCIDPALLDDGEAQRSYYSCWYSSSVCSALLMPCFPQHHEQSDNENDYELENPNVCVGGASSNARREDATEIECTFQPPVSEETDKIVSETKLVEQLGSLCLDRVPNNPSQWMQRPLLLVATPNSGMVIRRIRRVADPSYFIAPTEPSDFTNKFIISGKVQLPINNGKEEPRHSLVIDFETPIFAGTCMFRIRDSDTSTSHKNTQPVSTGQNYFAKFNRKFQMVIRGRFLLPDVIMADCVTGMLLDKRLATAGSSSTTCSESFGCPDVEVASQNAKMSRFRKSKHDKGESLPPKWVLRAVVKVAGFFSPRMDADLECAHPRILSPLCSSAQTAYLTKTADKSKTPLDEIHSEPTPDSYASLAHSLNKAAVKKNINAVQYRKRSFDAVYDERMLSLKHNSNQSGSSCPCFDPDAEYTFEFLQHLVDYNELSLDMGMAFGKMKLGAAIRGQPIRFIAALRSDTKGKSGDPSSPPLALKHVKCLWSFDLWHESLYTGG